MHLNSECACLKPLSYVKKLSICESCQNTRLGLPEEDASDICSTWLQSAKHEPWARTDV